jgi:transcription antitermination factor NusG
MLRVPFELGWKTSSRTGVVVSTIDYKVEERDKAMELLEAATQQWYVAYTLPRHEKAVANRLATQEIVSYLPLYSEVRCWKRRRMEVELPLFPGYVFVRMLLADRIRILSYPGVIRLLSANGHMAVVSDEDIQSLQSSLETWKAKPYPFFTSGKRVQIRSGPFAGLKGTILRRNGKRKLIVSLDLIQSAMQLDLDAAEAQLAN